MRPDARPKTLAALRELYDGAWTRLLGTDGGRTLHWQGKLGLIFAGTAVIDAHHGFLSAMGDRFLLSRLAPVDKGQFSRALDHRGDVNRQMRRELAEVVAHLFAGRRTEPRSLNETEIAKLDDVLMLAVRLRGPVARDGRTRELERSMAPKAPPGSASWSSA
jgi:hypothetical protein